MDISILGLSLQVAAVATVINLPVALFLSWLMVKRRVRGRILLDIVVSLPLAVPPVVVGYFLLLMLGRDGPLGRGVHNLIGVDVAFTWVAAALASAVVSFPLMARAIMVAMAGVDERLEMSARSLGAGLVRVAFTITVPLAYRGILAGILLAGNIPGRTQTLPLAIFTNVQTGKDDAALRLVAITIALAVVTLLVHNWLLERTTRRA